jgi:2-polyprenyl-3-methyl-5-hydroxy-6-metoxy-1,4-benzoquinol methylase
MINRLHAAFHRPERGWDPVPAAHAEDYARREWDQGVKCDLLNELDRWVGGLAGKRVLDLGGGPGQYSLAFAARGADVTWYDVSGTYQRLAQAKATERGLSMRFALGYLDEAPQQLDTRYDLVFNRICWYYGWSDRSFASVVFTLVAPGGVGYVDTTHSKWQRESLSLSARVRTWLNDHAGLKIGHPFPPTGRVARLLLAKPVEQLLVDYSSPDNDRIVFRRARAAP